MNSNQPLKQVLDFNKKAFDNAFNVMKTVGDQSEKMLATYMDHASWIPDEGKKIIHDWVNVQQKGWENLIKAADENFTTAMEYFEKDQNEEA